MVINTKQFVVFRGVRLTLQHFGCEYLFQFQYIVFIAEDDQFPIVFILILSAFRLKQRSIVQLLIYGPSFSIVLIDHNWNDVPLSHFFNILWFAEVLVWIDVESIHFIFNFVNTRIIINSIVSISYCKANVSG